MATDNQRMERLRTLVRENPTATPKQLADAYNGRYKDTISFQKISAWMNQGHLPKNEKPTAGKKGSKIEQKKAKLAAKKGPEVQPLAEAEELTLTEAAGTRYFKGRSGVMSISDDQPGVIELVKGRYFTVNSVIAHIEKSCEEVVPCDASGNPLKTIDNSVEEVEPFDMIMGLSQGR